MKRTFTLLLALVFFLSCVPIQFPAAPRPITYTRVESAPHIQKEIPVYIGKDFGVEDQLHIDDAINAWNYALNGSMKLVVKSRSFDMEISTIQDVFRSEEGGFFIMTVDSKNCQFLPTNVAPDMMSLAWADLTSRHVVYIVRDRAQTQDIFGITLHEVGHILGANHYNHYGLMNPTYNLDEYKCIDSDTVDQISEFNHLNREYLNSCLYL